MTLTQTLRTGLFNLSLLLSIGLFIHCTGTHQNMIADHPENAPNQKRLHRSSGNISNPNEVKPNEKYPSNLSLDDMLRKVPGVFVSGSGGSATVTIRGVSSINSSNEPLYVLDGIPVGHNYATVANAVNPNDIQRINVLKGPDAAIYGVRAANGVILIQLKR